MRPAHGGRNPNLGCVSLCDDLKFPSFFDTESVRLLADVSVSKQIFIRQEVCMNLSKTSLFSLFSSFLCACYKI